MYELIPSIARLRMRQPQSVNPPQKSTRCRSVPTRLLFRSKKHTPAVYTDFLYRDPLLASDEAQNRRQEKVWRRYFKKSETNSAKYVLQGLVLEELTTVWFPLDGELSPMAVRRHAAHPAWNDWGNWVLDRDSQVQNGATGLN